MLKRSLEAVLLIALFLIASCGGGGSASSSAGDDTITLTVSGVPTQYSDSAQEVTITAYTSNNQTEMVIYLGVTGTTPSQMNISFNNDLLTPATSIRVATISYIIGGITYQGTTNCTITSLAAAMGGVVAGSFPNATLTATTNGLLTLTVSGTFSATRVN